MDHPTVLVIGGSGFIGSHLVAQLSADGWRVIVPTHRSDHARHLLLLPLVETVEADVHDEATLARLTEGMDAVINLVGILHSRPGSPYGPDFARAHVELPEKIVAACVAARVQRYLHMSALGAAIDAPSMYLRSKAAGEQAARANPALPVTIFRPSVVFGEEDHFLNLFAYLQKWFPLMPLAGADARFQPVYVGDVAHAFVQALKNPRTIGKTYELAGPKVYTLRELVELAGTYTGHRRPVIALPDAMARMQAMLLEHAPGTPLMSRDNLDSMKVDNVASGPIAPELELELTALEAVAPHYLSGDLPARRRDQFRSHAGR
jgi:uncharacterized protein YbjT (DUF2867 family)